MQFSTWWTSLSTNNFNSGTQLLLWYSYTYSKWERQGMNLLLEQQVTTNLQQIQEEKDRITVANTTRDLQLHKQLWCMNNVLHHLDTVEIHAPDFDHDINGSNNGTIDSHQDISTRPDLSSPSQYKSTDYRLPPSLSDWWTPASEYTP